MGSPELVSTGRRDEDIAAELREDVRPHLQAVVDVQNKATKLGIVLGFQITRDQFGRSFIQSIDVFKPL